jgi:hypothetical protein
MLPPGIGSQEIVVFVGGQKSNSITFQYSAPTIEYLSSVVGPSFGYINITVYGTNFVPAGYPISSLNISTTNINIAGNRCVSVVWINSTVAVCEIPSGSGVNVSLIVTVGNQISNSVNFTYQDLYLFDVYPKNGTTSGQTLLTIIGQNFFPEGSAPSHNNVTINGVLCTNITWVNSTIITALTPPGAGVNNTLIVATAGVLSNPLFFSYNPPYISSVSPSSTCDTLGCILTISGQNFGVPTSNIIAQIGSITCSSAISDGQHITCNVPAYIGTNYSVVVTVEGQTSNNDTTFSFHVPTIASLSSPVGPSFGYVSVTINGMSFVPSGYPITSLDSSTNISIFMFTLQFCVA